MAVFLLVNNSSVRERGEVMSAIWGKVLWEEQPQQDIDTLMTKCYRENYKIDRFGVAETTHCYMGCGIQYIYPTAEKECLPIRTESGNILFNADIVLDNRKELAQELQLDITCSDGDIAFRAYQTWGIDCVKKFLGLFTIAIWDNTKKEVVLASDQLSSRCLYYKPDETGVVFSTLLEAILQQDSSIKINEQYIKDYLAAPLLQPNVVAEETPYQGVYKLPQATILTITKDGSKSYKYWSPEEPLADCHCTNAEEYGTYFRNLLTTCVTDAIGGTDRKGIALSSGLDSSSVGTIAADLLKEKNEVLYAYTYVPEDKVDQNTKKNIYNETEDVKKIVAMHDNIIPHFMCNHGKNAISSIEEGLDTLEIPYKAFVNYPSLREIYEEASKEGCRIILTGQTGNSTISYGNADPIFFDLLDKKKYLTLLRALNRFAVHMRIPRRKFLISYWNYLIKLKKTRKTEEIIFDLENPFLTDDFLETYPLQERFLRGRLDLLAGGPVGQKDYQERLCEFPGCTYLGEWETKLGLKYGVLLRDPTRDRRIVQFCYHMPYEYFAYQGMTKWLIRGNMKDMLPKSILNNWDRHGVQNNDWLRRVERDWKQLKSLVEEAIACEEAEQYIDAEKVMKLIGEEGFQPTQMDASIAVYLFSTYIAALFVKKNQK